MKTLAPPILLLLLIIVSPNSAAAQAESKTYFETRNLLLKMKRAHEYEALKKLFEEGESRKSDLIRALSDSDQTVSLNAQTVIKYLADQQALSALENWYESRRTQTKEYWVSPVEVVTDLRYLPGSARNLPELILRSLYPDRKDGWGRLIANNRKSRTVLVEIVFGNIFTEGWHVALRRENGKWRLLSQSLVWES